MRDQDAERREERLGSRPEAPARVLEDSQLIDANLSAQQFSQTRASSAENSGTTPLTKFFTPAARAIMASAIVCWSSSVEAPFDFAPAKCACVQGPHPATADAARSTSSLVLGSRTSSKRTPMNCFISSSRSILAVGSEGDDGFRQTRGYGAHPHSEMLTASSRPPLSRTTASRRARLGGRP